MATVPADVDGPGDAELIEAVRKGTVSAYGALYERHVASAYNLARQLSRSPAEADDLVSEAFAKVLDTLRAGRGPDSAFRAYLLTALRHTAYDKTRRERKLELSDDVSTVSGVSVEAVSQEFDDTAVKGLDRSLAAQAFARLPERWQAVLWHTEIEGQSPAEVAPILGLTANGVSALAYRAREGLRQAYLQVHLAETTDRHCRAAAERLGAWTRGGLAKREKAQVEAHLDTCVRCRALAAELADVNGAMRGYVAPLVLGVAAAGYIAATGVVKVATIGTAATASGAAGAAGAAAAGPRQFLGVAASSVALAAAMVVGLTAGGESPEIPAAAPVPSQEAPPPGQIPPPPQSPPQQPPAQNPPPAEPPAAEPPAEENPPPVAPPQLPLPPQLDASGPATPVSLIAGGAPTDLPLTVRNTGGTVSEPVTAVLNLPAGVSAVPVDGFAAPRLLNLNGAKAGTVDCPGGTGTVRCSSGTGLQPGESVTLLFRLQAAEDSQGGQITGSVSAGTSVRVNVSVRVEVKPEETTDMVLLSVTVKSDVFGLFGLWVHPVVEVAVTNTGTSSRPVTLHLDQPAKVRWSSQEVACSVGGGTTCTTASELAPGETLKTVLRIHADPWPEHQPGRDQLAVSAKLGAATDSENVTLWHWLCPPVPSPEPTQPTTPSNPPEGEHPTHKPPMAPTLPEKPTDPTSTTTPPATTTLPTTTPTPPQPPANTTTPPPEPTPPGNGQGGMGGLLRWLLGG
ncbi:sigma-70 family RNA polymerase sigma factor [Actinophytocola algeriensis]|uniref:RNA polymerase sigma factor (Sigma-70 family) n=1 Tax=Actinophytocola algeriensis TaxID=1768010 RepID=A0A7W7VBC8_9PSEU|nr:sigma-70 family RNA polymerase sigma factor [Actinophytocola algeriensis]MBB4903900.1 RNA polymerase sigma factor (sigma-70 family) [Actinophytocola algeriensis]MBE1477243.1 RNA polymerase sigma factor (sigma-70 family) [Actinophytocola algeriensis]